MDNISYSICKQIVDEVMPLMDRIFTKQTIQMTLEQIYNFNAFANI